MPRKSLVPNGGGDTEIGDEEDEKSSSDSAHGDDSIKKRPRQASGDGIENNNRGKASCGHSGTEGGGSSSSSRGLDVYSRYYGDSDQQGRGGTKPEPGNDNKSPTVRTAVCLITGYRAQDHVRYSIRGYPLNYSSGVPYGVYFR